MHANRVDGTYAFIEKQLYMNARTLFLQCRPSHFWTITLPLVPSCTLSPSLPTLSRLTLKDVAPSRLVDTLLPPTTRLRGSLFSIDQPHQTHTFNLTRACPTRIGNATLLPRQPLVNHVRSWMVGDQAQVKSTPVYPLDGLRHPPLGLSLSLPRRFSLYLPFSSW